MDFEQIEALDSPQSEQEEEAKDSRQRLRPWLINRLDHGTIPGLEWINKNDQIFKVPWKHGGKQDWVPEQSQIFKEWACHTGKFREGVDTPTYAKWKTNLRCALNKAQDIQEIPELTNKGDPNPYKVYRFLKRKKKVQTPAVTVPEPTPVPVNTGSDVAPVPAFLNDFSSPDVNPEPTNMFPHPQNQLSVPSCQQDQQFYQPSCTAGWNILHNDQSLMDHDGTSPANASMAPTTYTYAANGGPAVYSSPVHPMGMNSMMTEPVSSTPGINPGSMVTNQVEQGYIHHIEESNHHLPFDKSVTSHDCVSRTGSEMYLEIIYRNNIINSQHITTQSRGCRLTYTVVPRNVEDDLPDVIQDALFGPDAKDRQLVELPQWPVGLCPENLLPSVNDLLTNMHRGIILECYSGNVYATRLCKTSIYYTSEFTQSPQKLRRYDDSIEKTKIFDMDNNFKPSLENYERKGVQAKRPSPYVYLYIGQKGSEAELSSLLVVVRITSCRALTLLNEVDKNRCQEHSMHISKSTSLDQLGDVVVKQLSIQQQNTGFF